MFDIDIPWSIVLLMAPLLLPWLAVPGALGCAWWTFRRRRNVYAALLALVLGAFGVPWLFLLGALVLDVAGHMSGRATGVTLGVAGFSLVTLVLWALNRAGARAK